MQYGRKESEYPDDEAICAVQGTVSPGGSADEGGGFLYRKNPPVRVAVGFDYKFLALLAKILPSRLVNWIVKMIYIG